MRRRDFVVSVLAVALAATAVPARAFVHFDFDQRYFVQPGFIVKDHTLVEARDDTFHLFYIKANETLPEAQRAKALGHATSTDLVHWQFHPDVIPVVPGTWEESFVWAPHIVEVNGFYFMYYTGVNHNYAQAIGLAASVDLYHWSKYPLNPVYTPSTAWAAWSTYTWSNCRDPFVFQDGGLWYLTTTATTSDQKGAVSLASSPDLVHWTDLGPLLVHPGPQAWHVLESSNVHYHNGRYHLFCTEQNIGGSTWMSAPTLQGPWDYAGRQPFDAGHATEVFQVRNKWMLSRHTTFTFEGLPRYVIKFDDLEWDTAEKPIIREADPLAGWTIWSGDAFYLQPTFWDNAAARGADPSAFGGNSYVGTAELFTGPLRVGYPGLAAGEAPQGRMRTAPFTLSGNRLSFRLGGGDDIEHIYMALYTADDTELRMRSTGHGTDAMSEVVWDTSAWTGKQVFLEIADLSSAPMGHVNVDEISEYYEVPVAAAAAPAARLVLQQNVPNPFNPSTTIALEIPAAGPSTLALYDVRGRLVRSLYDGLLAAGPHVFAWDGTLADGRRAPSGVYYYRLRFAGRPPLVRTMVLLQ
jgi:hypothetical protein